MSNGLFARLRDSPLLVATGGAGDRSGMDFGAAAWQLSQRLLALKEAHALARDGHSVPQVMLDCADRYDFAVAMFASWLAGCAIAVPPGSNRGVRDALAQDADVIACLVDGRSAGPPGDAEPRVGSSHRPPQLEVCSGGSGDQPPMDWEPSPGRLAAVLHTSGSTGEPHSIHKNFRQLLTEARVHAASEVCSGARVLATVPPHHIYGLLWGTLAPLLSGGSFVRETPLLAAEIAGAAERHQAQVLVAVPAHLRALAAADHVPPCVRYVISSGAPLTSEVAAQLESGRALRVLEILGSTETGGVASREPARDRTWQPLPGVKVRCGEDGAMLVSSPFTDAGPAALQTSADRIELLEDGRFKHLGRGDSVVKVAGRRVDLAALEARLRELPEVREAFVVAVPVPGIRGQEIGCVVVGPSSLDRRRVRAHLGGFFDRAELPRRVRVVDGVARSETGKVLRKTLLGLLGVSVSTTAQVFDREPEHAVEFAASDGGVAGTRVRVRPDAWCFRGHFDGHPVLPGVVQLSDLVLPQARARWPELSRLRGASQLKFKSPIGPGDLLELQLSATAATKTGTGDGGAELTQVRFEIHGETGVCSSGCLLFECDTNNTDDDRRPEPGT